jgi:hypothetical protein
MLVFIDESGDPGFKVAAGSSPIFALGMVIFDDHDEAARTQALVARTRVRLGVKPEFKFNKCRSDLRDQFFDAVSDCGFRVRAIVVRKDALWSERLRSNAESFYSFFLKTMMTFNENALVAAKIVIDGSGDQRFRRNLGAYVRRHTSIGAVTQVRLKSSRAEPLLQLADMCVGAIARAYRTDDRGTDRWRARLAGNIDDVWEFK